MDEYDIRARRYAVVIGADGEGGYLAKVPDFPGVIAGGATPEEALSCAYDGIASIIMVDAEDGDPVPEPSDYLAGVPA